MNPFNVAGKWLKKTFKSPKPVLLFLDVDGVLHPYGYDTGRAWVPFEQAGRLREALATRPYVKVVMHSSWRFKTPMVELREWLDIGDQFIGITDEKIAERWPSIKKWLSRKDPWPPAAYVILDDMWFAFPEEIRKNHLICPVASEGMSEEQWLEMEARLDELAYR